MIWICVLQLFFSTLAGSGEESARDWILRGDVAAREDRHADAVKAYEMAIRVDDAVRPAVLPKLGRQYLWSESSAKAVLLFDEYLEVNPHDCSAQSDRALALSWNGRMNDAREAYQVLRSCPGLKMAAIHAPQRRCGYSSGSWAHLSAIRH